jgi:hypothetical protein
MLSWRPPSIFALEVAMRPLLILFWILLLAAQPAHAQWIGIFSDIEGNGNQITAPQYTPTTFYIHAVYANALDPPGLQGAEFAVEHDITSSEAVITSEPSPLASLSLGDPMSGGCNLGFPVCQSEAVVLLYSVSITVLDAGTMTNRYLVVTSHSSPSNPNFECPLLNKCDAPLYTATCVATGFACINDQGGFCTFAVETSTWSEVKSLYTN